MKVTGFLCHKCNTIVYSRALHDFRRCKCGAIFVDGGFDYCRIGYEKKPPMEVSINLPKVTKKMLYDDWNLGKNKYGWEESK